MSGWINPPWRGTFYPAGLSRQSELEYASSKLDTIELNNTFYCVRPESDWTAWRERTPDDFVFAVKGLGAATRQPKPEKALDEFFASGILTLGEKLGPILWQFPPTRVFDPAQIERFVALLPSTVRSAIEPRHPSFDEERYFAILEKYGVGSVVAETTGKSLLFSRVTSDFVYVRLHGDPGTPDGAYSEAEVQRRAERIHGWVDEGRDVFAYLGGSVKPTSPLLAMNLADRIRALG